MAHTLFLTRGHIDKVESFIKEFRERYLSMPLPKNFTKGDMSMPLENQLIKIRLQPIQLWDVAYPKHHRDAIHTTLFSKGTGKPVRERENKFIWTLKKIFGLESIPDYEKKSWLPMSFPESIDIIGIGVKDDYWIEPDGTKTDEKNKSDFAFEGI